jgi:integrase
MSFVTDKAELKPGLVLFRRGDVDHRMWYCRMKIPKADRYKTVSLKTTDIEVARERAFDQDADIRFRLKHDVPVFNHPFREVGREYLLTQEARAKRGEISAARPKKVRAVIEGALDRYVGSTQVHLIGDELWAATRHGGGRTARVVTRATAFGKSATTWRKPSRIRKPSAAPRFSRPSASGF